MEIKIQYKRRVFAITFGRRTKFFDSMYFFTIIEEFYDRGGFQITYAKMIVGWFPKKALS